MKKVPAFSYAFAAVVAAFFVGRWSGSETDEGTTVVTRQARPMLPRAANAPAPGLAETASAPAQREKDSMGGVSPEEARKLTREERITLIRQGSLILDEHRQAEYLAGVIPVLNKEELDEAMAIMLAAHHRGHHAAQPVWDALWLQTGRVDPVACLTGQGLVFSPVSGDDTRNVIKGWFETDPAAAVAWAHTPGKTGKEARAAATLISMRSKGDLKAMEVALLAFPPGDAVRKDMMLFYLDHAAAAAQGEPATAYAALPPELKKDGWGATLKHLVYGEPQAAVDWLTKYAGEPGTDYTAASRLIRDISKDDPAAATAWVSRLPEVVDAENGRAFHPVTQTFDVWLRTDAAAAGAWLAQQSTQAQWLTDLRTRFANQNQ